MKKFVDDFVKVSEEVERDRDDIRKKYDKNGLGFTYGSDELEQFTEETEPLNNKLRNYLELLTKDQLIILSALMYGGRDSNKQKLIPFDKLKETVSDEKEIMIKTILSKSPRADYIKKGLKLYSSEIN